MRKWKYKTGHMGNSCWLHGSIDMDQPNGSSQRAARSCHPNSSGPASKTTTTSELQASSAPCPIYIDTNIVSYGILQEPEKYVRVSSRDCYDPFSQRLMRFWDYINQSYVAIYFANKRTLTYINNCHWNPNLIVHWFTTSPLKFPIFSGELPKSRGHPPQLRRGDGDVAPRRGEVWLLPLVGVDQRRPPGQSLTYST